MLTEARVVLPGAQALLGDSSADLEVVAAKTIEAGGPGIIASGVALIVLAGLRDVYPALLLWRWTFVSKQGRRTVR